MVLVITGWETVKTTQGIFLKMQAIKYHYLINYAHQLDISLGISMVCKTVKEISWNCQVSSNLRASCLFWRIVWFIFSFSLLTLTSYYNTLKNHTFLWQLNVKISALYQSLSVLRKPAFFLAAHHCDKQTLFA